MFFANTKKTKIMDLKTIAESLLLNKNNRKIKNKLSDIIIKLKAV